MKKALVCLPIAAALCGCSSVSFSRTDAQGNKTTMSANSLLQKRQGVNVTGKDASGLDVGFKEESVAGDVQMVKALSDFADRMMSKGAAAAATGGIAPAVGAATNVTK